MLNFDVFRRRLAQYGAAWLLAFFLVLVGTFALRLGLNMPLAGACDVMLSISFVALGLVWAWFAIVTLLSGESVMTKLVLIVGALILLIPLLWAPVLGAILTAWIGHAEIEYSNVYAQFRVVLGTVLYTLTKLIFGNPLVDAAMSFFQGLATFVGFIAACAQLYEVFGRKRVADS